MAVKFGRGQCGGHVTLIFAINDLSEEPLEQGSLGAGLCLEDGIEVISRGEEGNFGLNVKFLNGSGSKTLYQDVLEVLSEDIPEIKNYFWELNIRLSLPISQGFGMSASGAIAAASSLQRALGVSHEESKRRSYLVAHLIERKRSTGLGDTTGLVSGGVERRIKEGSPFSGILLDKGPGESEGWAHNIQLLLAWKSESGRHTSEYIDNREWKEKITKSGIEKMNLIGKGVWDSSRWEELLLASEEFASESGLILDSDRSVILEDANRILRNNNLQTKFIPLLCMLGRSIVVLPRDIKYPEFGIDRISEELKKIGYNIVITQVSDLL